MWREEGLLNFLRLLSIVCFHCFCCLLTTFNIVDRGMWCSRLPTLGIFFFDLCLWKQQQRACVYVFPLCRFRGTTTKRRYEKRENIIHCNISSPMTEERHELRERNVILSLGQWPLVPVANQEGYMDARNWETIESQVPRQGEAFLTIFILCIFMLFFLPMLPPCLYHATVLDDLLVSIFLFTPPFTPSSSIRRLHPPRSPLFFCVFFLFLSCSCAVLVLFLSCPVPRRHRQALVWRLCRDKSTKYGIYLTRGGGGREDQALCCCFLYSSCSPLLGTQQFSPTHALAAILQFKIHSLSGPYTNTQESWRGKTQPKRTEYTVILSNPLSRSIQQQQDLVLHCVRPVFLSMFRLCSMPLPAHSKILQQTHTDIEYISALFYFLSVLKRVIVLVVIVIHISFLSIPQHNNLVSIFFPLFCIVLWEVGGRSEGRRIFSTKRTPFPSLPLSFLFFNSFLLLAVFCFSCFFFVNTSLSVHTPTNCILSTSSSQSHFVLAQTLASTCPQHSLRNHIRPTRHHTPNTKHQTPNAGLDIDRPDPLTIVPELIQFSCFFA